MAIPSREPRSSPGAPFLPAEPAGTGEILALPAGRGARGPAALPVSRSSKAVKAPGLSLSEARSERRDLWQKQPLLSDPSSSCIPPSLSSAQIPSAEQVHQPGGCTSPPFPGTLRAWWLSKPLEDVCEDGHWQVWCRLGKKGLTDPHHMHPLPAQSRGSSTVRIPEASSLTSR